MDSLITPEWVAGLRRDIKAWDVQVEEARKHPIRRQLWDWPDTTPPLTYGGPEAEYGPGGRRRRASTSVTIGSGQRPPSEVFSQAHWRRVKMQMRLPVHLWAMLSRGREAEAVDYEQVVVYDKVVKGLCRRERWREYDGEQRRTRTEEEGVPRAWKWTEWYVQRMEWTRRGGVWRGAWELALYDQLEHEGRPGPWKSHSVSSSSAAWASLPQEVLLGMVREMEKAKDRKGLAAASGVCHAWLKICAPRLYRDIGFRPLHVKELIEDLSRSCSSVAQHAERAKFHGPIPWMALPTLLKLLPRLRELTIREDKGAPLTTYHPTAPRMVSGVHVASRITLALSSLSLRRQWFASAAHVLWLFALFPHLTSATLDYCTIQTASTASHLVPATHLKSIVLRQGEPGVVHEGAIPSLTQWWRWPHVAVESTTMPYPGLHGTDAQEVFAITRSAACGMTARNSVNLLLRNSWCSGSWILMAEMPSAKDQCMEVEFHVTYRPPVHLTNSRYASGCARVEHIVIRLNTLGDHVPVLSCGDVLESMATFMTRLSALRTVTLETPDAEGHASHAWRLAGLDADGKVRLRTCTEAQQVAQAAMQDPCSRAKTMGVVSPLWYSKGKHYGWMRNRWLKLADAMPKQHEPSTATIPVRNVPDVEDRPPCAESVVTDASAVNATESDGLPPPASSSTLVTGYSVDP